MTDYIELKRHSYEDKQTLGNWYLNDVHVCATLELPWLQNNPRISCIPTGIYKVIRRHSSKHGHHFHITNVPNRSLILIHRGNYHYQLLGCIAVGSKHIDLNKDGYLDVANSKQTMQKLLELLPNTFDLIIR